MKVKTIKIVCIISLLVLLIALAIISLVPSLQGKIDAQNSTGHYDGRAEGDYNDDYFDYDGYLVSLGTRLVEVDRKRNEDGQRRIAYKFTLDDLNYELASVMYPIQLADDEYAGASGAWSFASTIEIDDGKTKYVLNPVGYNTVGIVSAYHSSMYLTRDVFDVFHVITSENADFYYGTAEGNCPFRNLGVPHFIMRWNGSGWEFDSYCDDAGEPRYDLHF
ncbi:MAG: hypothetical protein Q4E47_01035 [Candidatus Saccharibacteria bacterium]|nr:hypothetical protein [Candidatus Saccharibacteria bacterium]